MDPTNQRPQHWSWVEQICRDESDRYVWYAYRYVRDLDRAKQIVQNAYVKALEQPPGKFETADSLRRWLYVTIRHACLDWLRSADHQRTETNADDLDDEGEPRSRLQTASSQGPYIDPARIAETREFLQTMLECDGLTDRQRAVLELIWLRGYTQTEAAEALGISSWAVRDRIQSARPALLRCYLSYRDGQSDPPNTAQGVA